MKIVHVYAKNLQIFSDSVEGTECRLNGSSDLKYLTHSLVNYNARDVLGLIVFATPMTKRVLKLIKTFDELFIFNALPIIVVSDVAEEVYRAGYLKVKHSKLFLVESINGTVSDIDVSRMFTTLVCLSDTMYDLSPLPSNKQDILIGSGERTDKISDNLTKVLKWIDRGVVE